MMLERAKGFLQVPRARLLSDCQSYLRAPGGTGLIRGTADPGMARRHRRAQAVAAAAPESGGDTARKGHGVCAMAGPQVTRTCCLCADHPFGARVPRELSKSILNKRGAPDRERPVEMG